MTFDRSADAERVRVIELPDDDLQAGRQTFWRQDNWNGKAREIQVVDEAAEVVWRPTFIDLVERNREHV